MWLVFFLERNRSVDWVRLGFDRRRWGCTGCVHEVELSLAGTNPDVKYDSQGGNERGRRGDESGTRPPHPALSPTTREKINDEEAKIQRRRRRRRRRHEKEHNRNRKQRQTLGAHRFGQSSSFFETVIRRCCTFCFPPLTHSVEE